jgi:hypothetical protein
LDNWKPVGVTQAHAKSTFIDKNGYKIDGIGFGLAENMPSPGSKVEVVFSPQINEFNGRITVQANLLAIQ